MKRTLLIISAVALLGCVGSLAVIAGQVKRAYGSAGTTTNGRFTVQTIPSNNWLRSLNVYNTNGADMHVLVNVGTSEFAAVFAITNCAIIPAGAAYQFEAYDGDWITQWISQCQSGTSLWVTAGQ